MSTKTSKVYLVGAGPGDAGLLTLKAKEVLAMADVVIYDYLANPELLNHAPNAEKINAGKRHGNAHIAQNTINELLVRLAQEGKTVVRLKGGDPFVFGRGGEELLAIHQAKIPFEVVPGVSSVNAVPAYAGIPLTHRELTSNVVFLTGTENPAKPETMIPWQAVAQMGTIVILMGLNSLKINAQKLIEAGKAPETSVALIQWGTWPRQKTVLGSLGNVAELAEAHQMKAPMLTVIGEVTQLAKQFNWFESLPLFGQQVLITRKEDSQGNLSALLQQQGADLVHAPVLRFDPPISWESFDDCLRASSRFDWVVFTSANAVKFCLERVFAVKKDVRCFGGMRIACVGPATAAALKDYGLVADLVPKQFQGEGLIEAFSSTPLQNCQVWFPRAEKVRGNLAHALSQMGAQVHSSMVYRTACPETLPKAVLSQLQENIPDWVTFTSSSTVRNLFQLLPESVKLKWKAAPPRMACIGEITALTLKEYGWQATVIPQQQDLPGLVQAMCDHQLSLNAKVP